jgi:hypothetical protein
MNMKRHEARAFFEQLVSLRRRYELLGGDDHTPIMSVEAALAYGELLGADLGSVEAAIPPDPASSQDDYANQTGY